jgi:hypothetical protein
MEKVSEIPKFTIDHTKSYHIDIDHLVKQYSQTEEDKQASYNPFEIFNYQTYQPIYKNYFGNIENIEDILLNQKWHFVDMNHVQDCSQTTSKTCEVFTKFSPLLDPLKYVIGKYDVEDSSIRTLPSSQGKTFHKLEDIHNVSYVDGFFSYLSSQLLNHHGFIHGIDYYGSYLMIQKQYKMNLTEDFDYVNDYPFFKEQMNKLFTVSSMDEYNSYYNYGSRSNKQKIQISNQSKHNITQISFVDLSLDNEAIPENTNIDTIEELNTLVYEKTETENNNNDKNDDDYKNDSKHSITSHSSDYSDNSEANYSTEDSDEETETKSQSHKSDSENNEDSDSVSYETISDDDEEEESMNDLSTNADYEEPYIYAYIKNFPAQMICLEKCVGTLDKLFVREKIDEENGISALFQIIMILITYQNAFHFTHNDLHTNNIMYVNTEHEFIYYEYKDKVYKVPTYGRIYKLIDFGRGIYKFQGRTLCSDSFAAGGDAATQYNFEPFFNNKKPRLEPNYSFDLCRLGCSIYDFIINDEDELRDMDELQQIIYRWCMDDNDKNVLYKKNGEERYPNFKLYKMIARTVHKHTPHAQLECPAFAKFEISKKEWSKWTKSSTKPALYMNINQIPCYV